MKTLLFLFAALLLFFDESQAKTERYGDKICQQEGYSCYTVAQGDSWESLWPEESQRLLMRKLNRLNLRLREGMILAVPTKLDDKTAERLIPFDSTYETGGEKLILVDLNKLAWAAYNSDGILVHWAPASGGRGYCADIKSRCRTPVGDFRITFKRGASCKSSKFPIPTGGAKIPFCTFFVGGVAIHGSPDVPGYNASHGCVRTFREDAQWLNESFVDIPSKEDQGTKVIVLPYN